MNKLLFVGLLTWTLFRVEAQLYYKTNIVDYIQVSEGGSNYVRVRPPPIPPPAWYKGSVLKAVAMPNSDVVASPVSTNYLYPPSPTYGTANLVWQHSRSPDVVGYFVYYSTLPKHYTAKLYVGNVTNCSIGSLVIGVTYYFAMTAKDELGRESPKFSNEIAYTATVGPEPPIVDTFNAELFLKLRAEPAHE